MKFCAAQSRESLVVAVPVFALALAMVFGCGKKETADSSAATGAALATVNGQPISTSDFDTYVLQKSTVLVSTPQGPQMANTFGPLGLQAFRDIVNRQLILQIAKEENVAPTDAQVQAEIDRQNKLQPGLMTNLEKQGISLDEIKKDTMFNLARDNVITKGVTVTMSEVDAFIKENPKRFTQPATDSLLIIGVRSAAQKGDVDKALAAGKSFKDVAMQYSQLPNAKQTGGAFPAEPVEQLAAPIRDALAKTAPLHATDWIDLKGTFIKFYVQSKTADKKVDVSPDVKKELQRELTLQRGQQTSDLEQKIQQKLLTSTVDISNPMLKPQWDQLVAQMKQASATARPGGPPPAGSAPAGAPPAAPSGPAGAPPSPSPASPAPSAHGAPAKK